MTGVMRSSLNEFPLWTELGGGGGGVWQGIGNSYGVWGGIFLGGVREAGGRLAA